MRRDFNQEFVMCRYQSLLWLAGAGCFLGLGLFSSHPAAAQQVQTLPSVRPETAVVQESSQAPAAADAALPPLGAFGGGPTPPAMEKKEKSFWETNPPIWPLPRPGWFLIFPTGPGYYSLSDYLHDNERETPPVFPYSPISFMPGSFFNANFLYLENPDNQQTDIFDCLHRIHCGDNWMFSTGGEERLRFMDETDSRLTTTRNDYLLERTRIYGDLWYSNLFRVYVEFLDARSTHQELNPLPIDQNHGDLLNAFIDVNVFGMDKYPIYARIGRQEMLLGSERLISPLDWANTRRTFQGISVFRQGEKFDVTAFAVQPVIPNPDDFDSVDDLQNFYGVWTTYRPRKGETIDLYWLDLNNANPNFVGANGAKGGFNVYTIGSRWAGDYHHFLWDEEGMYQWGDWGSNQEISAAAYTLSAGYQLAKLPMNPQFWVGWDWASGNHNLNGPEHGTFNQLFPFGHYYFGYLDVVGRQNIEDLNAQLAFFPAKWWLVLLQWHHFWLESPSDALYAASGAVLRSDPTGQSGRNVGNEIDWYMNFHLDAHQDVVVGYSKLFAGDFIRNTGPDVSPGLFYVQYSFRW
jgi:hypothetical protein